MKKIILIVSIGLGFISGAGAIAIEPLNLEGMYSCVGNDNTGKLLARIDGKFSLKKQHYVYLPIQLDTKTNQQLNDPYNEMAIQKGSALAIAYQSKTNPKIFGVEIMQISNKNPLQLKGIFVEWNNFNNRSKEICTRQ